MFWYVFCALCVRDAVIVEFSLISPLDRALKRAPKRRRLFDICLELDILSHRQAAGCWNCPALDHDRKSLRRPRLWLLPTLLQRP